MIDAMAAPKTVVLGRIDHTDGTTILRFVPDGDLIEAMRSLHLCSVAVIPQYDDRTHVTPRV